MVTSSPSMFIPVILPPSSSVILSLIYPALSIIFTAFVATVTVALFAFSIILPLLRSSCNCVNWYVPVIASSSISLFKCT